MSEHSAHLTSLPFGFRTWLWRYTCLLLLISMLWHRQAIFESKGDKLSSSAEGRIRTWKSQGTYSPADWMPTHKPTELSRIKLKTWTQQPVPMMSEHSAHLTSLPFGFRTWLWRYTCLLLLISMLWHRQAIFESKGDKLSSSAEGRIRTWKSQGTYSPADWMPTHKPTELSRIKLKNLNSTAHTYIHTYIVISLHGHRRVKIAASCNITNCLRLNVIMWKNSLGVTCPTSMLEDPGSSPRRWIFFSWENDNFCFNWFCLPINTRTIKFLSCLGVIVITLNQTFCRF